MRSVILTRPIDQAEAFAAHLRKRFLAEVHCCPLIEIETQMTEWPEGIEGVIFTSANAVKTVEPMSGRMALCVGNSTAEVARDAGFDAVSADGSAKDVFDLLIGDEKLRAMSWFYPHGAHVSGDLVGRLVATEVQVADVITYQQVVRNWTAAERNLALNTDAVLPVFSPNGARKLISEIGANAPKGVGFVAISPQVGEIIAAEFGSCVRVAERPTRDAMLAAIGEELEVQR